MIKTLSFPTESDAPKLTSSLSNKDSEMPRVVPRVSLLLIFAFFLIFSCEHETIDKKELPKEGEASVSIPNEQRVISVAKSFVRIYLKDRNAESFISKSQEFMNGDFAPTFNVRQGRWYVFFSDGINTLNVTMSKNLEDGTVSSQGSSIISSEDNRAHLKGDYSDLPLFDLSEFDKIIDLPHNRER